MTDKVNILGVEIDNLTSEDLNELIREKVNSKNKDIVSNVNIHAMNISRKLPWFRNFLNQASINFCDGDGVRLGAKLLKKDIVEKITYNKWIWDFASFSQKNSITWYLVGSREVTIKKAKDCLSERFPDLRILGCHHGYLTEKELNKSLLLDIEKKRPNVLILGMGMPVQEKWLQDNENELFYNVALTGGAVFDYVSGEAKMTPQIFFDLKLEWFYRFLNDPIRLFKRYFIGNLWFIVRIIASRIKMVFSQD